MRFGCSHAEDLAYNCILKDVAGAMDCHHVDDEPLQTLIVTMPASCRKRRRGTVKSSPPVQWATARIIAKSDQTCLPMKSSPYLGGLPKE
jgi:hypothetical protein